MRGVWIVLTCALLGCKAPAKRGGEAETSTLETGLALDLDLPTAWAPTYDSTDGVVVAGPAGTDAYFTTITIQEGPEPGPLLSALQESYGGTPLERVTFSWLEPTLVDGHLALRYVVSFIAHEQPRLRTGVLVGLRQRLVDIRYTAPLAYFAGSLPIFEAAIDSVAFLDAGGLGEL
jgi:hypothetical protein